MSAAVILMMMNASRNNHHYSGGGCSSTPPAQQQRLKTPYEVALETLEAKEESKRIAAAELHKQARALRSQLNEVADSAEGSFLRKAMKIAGQSYELVGKPVYYLKETIDGTEFMGAWLAITPSGFRICNDPRSNMESVCYEPDLRWKWTSLMIELVKGGVTLQSVTAWVKEQAKKRLEEANAGGKQAVEPAMLP